MSKADKGRLRSGRQKAWTRDAGRQEPQPPKEIILRAAQLGKQLEAQGRGAGRRGRGSRRRGRGRREGGRGSTGRGRWLEPVGGRSARWMSSTRRSSASTPSCYVSFTSTCLSTPRDIARPNGRRGVPSKILANHPEAARSRRPADFFNPKLSRPPDRVALSTAPGSVAPSIRARPSSRTTRCGRTPIVRSRATSSCEPRSQRASRTEREGKPA